MAKSVRSSKESAVRQERRRARRFAASWEVSVSGKDPAGAIYHEKGSLENLSSTGAFLFLTREVEVGERVELQIKIPFKSENWMKYSAEVVRVEPSPPRIGVGMKFDTSRPAFVTG